MITIHNHVYISFATFNFDAAEIVGISRDLAYASVVLGSSNNVKFPLA